MDNPMGPDFPRGDRSRRPMRPADPRTEGVAAERHVGPEAGANGIGARIEARPSGYCSMSSLRESVCSRTSVGDVREHADSLRELMILTAR